MTIRNMKKSQYNAFYNALQRKARFEPYDTSCTVDMTVDGVEYILKLNPDRNKVALLYGLRVGRDEGGRTYEMVTSRCLLISLMEILILHEIGWQRRTPLRAWSFVDAS